MHQGRHRRDAYDEDIKRPGRDVREGKALQHNDSRSRNSIGERFHTGDNEIFYFLSGTGVYNDNGTEVRVRPGDTAVCSDGEKHRTR